MGLWKFLYPKEAINYVLNPSAETSGNVAALSGATVSQSTTYAFRGRYSHKVISAGDADGIQFTLKALPNAACYIDCWTYGTLPATWKWRTGDGTYTAPTLLGTEGSWSHYGLACSAAESTTHTTLDMYQEGVDTPTYYIDCVKVEQDTTWTTYFDGDEPGCSWQGTKHGSASFRPGNVRSGGYVKDLVTDYDVAVQVRSGHGGPTKESMLDPLALVDGSVYQGTRASGRMVTLEVTIKGTSLANYYSKRKAFMSAISRHLVTPQQPVTWRYTGPSKTVQFAAFVEGGDEGNFAPGASLGDWETIPLRLLAVEDPYWEELAEGSGTLVNSQTLAVEQMVAYRPSQEWSATTGHWDALGAPELDSGTAATEIHAMAMDINHTLFVGGDFLNLNGIANADYVAQRSSGGVWSALAAGINNLVLDIVPAPDGATVFIIGKFTNVGDANGDYCIKWTVAGFASLDVGPGTTCKCGVIGRDGKLYVGFQGAGTGAQTIRTWDGSAWADFAVATSSATHTVNRLAVGGDGKIYACGTFLTIGGVSDTVRVAYYDPYEASPAWHPMATGLSTTVSDLCIAKNGKVYASAGDDVWVWEGQAWRTIITVTGGTATIHRLAITRQGDLYFAGDFTAANGISIADRCGVWNGTTTMPLPIDLPGSANVYALLPVVSGALNVGGKMAPDDVYIGFDTEGNATISGLSSASGIVTCSGTAPCYPVITIACTVAACTLQEVRNATTGHVIRFNRAMQIGETITIDTRDGYESVTSDFPPPGGSTVTMLMPSDLGTFCLMPGNNNVSVYAPGTGATVAVTMRWRIKHDGAEGGAT